MKLNSMKAESISATVLDVANKAGVNTNTIAFGNYRDSMNSTNGSPTLNLTNKPPILPNQYVPMHNNVGVITFGQGLKPNSSSSPLRSVNSSMAFPLSNPPSTRVSPRASTNSTNALTNSNIDDLLEMELAKDLYLKNFYDTSTGSFPFKFVPNLDKAKIDEAKDKIKDTMNEIRNNYETKINAMINNDTNVNMANFKNEVTSVQEVVLLLSRVFVCILVSEFSSQDVNLQAKSQTTDQLQKRVDNLKQMLADTLPFLLKIEGDNNNFAG
jgi:flagellar biosynthesis chaperone FliJ